MASLQSGRRRRSTTLLIMGLVFFPFLFLASCTVTTFALFWGADDLLFKEPVGTDIPETLPVAVFVRRDGKSQAVIVEHRSMKAVQEKYPEYSFLVPDGTNTV